MRNRVFRAIVVWGEAGGEEDADEIDVAAASEVEAVLAAKRKWRSTVGLRWPKCRIRDVIVNYGKRGVAATI